MPIHPKRYVLIAFQKMQMQKTGLQKHVSQQLQIRIITRAKQLPGSRQVCSNEEICPDWSLIWPTDKHHTPSVKATCSVRLVLAALWTAQVYPPGLKTSTHVLQRLLWLFKVLKYVVKSTKQHAAIEVMKYQVYLSLHDWNTVIYYCGNHYSQAADKLYKLIFTQITVLYILMNCEIFLFWPAGRCSCII